MKPWLKNIHRVDVLPRPGGIDLRYSEWTEQVSKELFDKFRETLTWEDFALYPDTNILKDRLAILHNVFPINIYLAPGSAEAIKSVFDCMNLGESTLTTDPCFPMYDVYATQNNLTIDKVKPNKNQYKIKETLNDLIVFSRPSSPMGYFQTREQIIKILENNPTTLVLVDEAYIDYVENKDSIIDLISVYDNLIISRSFSKTFGAAGCRIGYLISHSMNIDIFSKFRQMYEISGPAMKYAMFLLDNMNVVEDYCNRTITERNLLIGLFENRGIEVIGSQGNWIHVRQDVLLDNFLIENKISVKTNIKLPTYESKWIRLTVGPGVFSLFEKFLQKPVLII